jgi:hypothetical protein
MKDALFSPVTHKKLKANVEKNYKEFIEDVREDLKNGFNTDIVDPQFLDQLNDIVNDVAFDNYSPLKFYWMNLLDNLIYLIQLHEEILSSEEFNETNEELSAPEEELYHLWRECEFAEQFLDLFNEGLPVLEISDQLLPLLENQIISFYVLHINQYQQEFDDALIYQAVPELGEFEKRLYLGEGHHIVDLQKTPESFPSLPIKAFRPENLELWTEVKEEDLKNKIKLNAPSIEIENFSLFVIPSCEQGIKRQKEFQTNIETALKRIKTAAPHLFDVFKSFTHTIIPMKDAGIVSYSMQSLPGVSSINMFERDQIDLMDDLLHENGHHYLNTYLNHLDLINEDDELIYYSPWRKALRPIRGIYHSVFTFFWALELFHGLIKSIDNSHLGFSKAEKTKIHARFLEEYYMLMDCHADLQHAYKSKKITKAGHDLLTDIYNRINGYKKFAQESENSLSELSKSNYKIISELKTDLAKQRIHYGILDA